MMDRNSSTDWDDLRVFLAVLRAGSLRGAARLLRLNHATVNRRLVGLEVAFGTRLFDRTRAGLVPTQAGEDLLATAERVEDELLKAQRDIAGRDGQLDGRIKVSLPYAIMKGFLAADLHAFSARYPGIALDLELTDRFSDLAQLEADVSIRMAHDVTGDAVGRRLMQYAKTIYAAPVVAERFDPSSDGGDASPDWLGWPGADGSNAWSRGTPFPRLHVRHNLPSHALQLEAAKAGMGLAMLPCFLGDPEPGLVRAPGATPVPDRSIWLLLRAGLRTTARVRAFAGFIAAAILDRRALLEGRAYSHSMVPGGFEVTS